jgi:hypothetical protein
MGQVHEANDTLMGAMKPVDRSVENRRMVTGFLRRLAMAIAAIVWLISGEITNNKRHLIL